MFAEINKKIPKLDRWEDLLTSGFFGPLRYTSSFASVIKKLLEAVKFENKLHYNHFHLALNNLKDEWEIIFWKKLKQKEIDLLIINKKIKVVIGIEIKYESELSGNDQLSNYANLLKEKYEGYNRFLIFLAKDISAKSIYDSSYKKVIKKDEKTNGFGYVSWQMLYRKLEIIKSTTHPNKLIVNDLLKYLKSKNLHGFIRFEHEILNSPKINPHQKYLFN
ncbi:MAG: PD-(D/E)XK nuclease family protein [Saprospiraceae bacterium]